MKTRTVFSVVVLLLIILAQSAWAANDDNLTVSLAGHVITASGVTPGSSAVFFGIALVPIPHAYMNRARQWAVTVEDTAHKGIVTFDLQEDVPSASVWAVVDLRNAHYGIASGPGAGLREIALSNPLRKGQSQVADRFLFDHPYLELLYVHPGLGAWTWSAAGGASSEQDAPPNSTIVSLTDGKAVGPAAQKPPSFLPGGILVAVDALRIQFAVVHVDQQLIGGAR